MAEKSEKSRIYVKPEVRQIKLSLAELTLGTNCDRMDPAVAAGLCEPPVQTCNI